MNPFDIQRLIAPHLAEVQNYAPTDTPARGRDVLKLDLNESPVPPSPRVLEALRSALTTEAALNWYPDSGCAALRSAIGQYLDLSSDHVLVTNGSNQAMELIARTFLTRNDTALVVSPVYAVFPWQCRVQEATVKEVYFTDPFAPRIEELLEHGRGSRFKALYLANPNNPTGIGYSEEQLRTLLETWPESLVVVDEAYNEFHGVSAVGLTEMFGNLVVLRSFSKAFSLAGLRCGYVVAARATREALQRVAEPWAVSTLTQVAARAALEDTAHMQAFVAECRAAKRKMVEGLTRLGQTAWDTEANFVLWRTTNPARVTAELAARGVLVNNKDSVPQMRGVLRVTAGTQAQAERFLETAAIVCAAS